MKSLFIACCLFLFTFNQAFSQDEFELDSSQSMLMTGKGEGQDGTINPYAGQDCYAVVENFGANEFSVRIQQKGKVLELIPVKANETKKIKLLKGQELYFDYELEGTAKARIHYEKLEKK